MELSAPVNSAEAVVLLHSHGQEQQGETVTMALAGRRGANPRFGRRGEGLFPSHRAPPACAVGRELLARAVRGTHIDIRRTRLAERLAQGLAWQTVGLPSMAASAPACGVRLPTYTEGQMDGEGRPARVSRRG